MKEAGTHSESSGRIELVSGVKRLIIMAVVAPALLGVTVGIIKDMSSYSYNSNTSYLPRALTLSSANPWDVMADFETGVQHIKPPETGNGALVKIQKPQIQK